MGATRVHIRGSTFYSRRGLPFGHFVRGHIVSTFARLLQNNISLDGELQLSFDEITPRWLTPSAKAKYVRRVLSAWRRHTRRQPCARPRLNALSLLFRA